MCTFVTLTVTNVHHYGIGAGRSDPDHNFDGEPRVLRIASAVVSDRITPEAVAKVAKLARLSLSDAELTGVRVSDAAVPTRAPGDTVLWLPMDRVSGSR